MPQFDPSVFPAQIFWLIVIFGLFWLVMSRLGLPRVERIYKDREERIRDDLDQAERMNGEAKSIREAYQATLQSARDEAQKITGEARTASAKKLAETQAEIDAKLDKRLNDSEAEIVKARDEALEEMNSVAVEAAKDLLARLSVKANTNKLKAAVKRELTTAKDGENS